MDNNQLRKFDTDFNGLIAALRGRIRGVEQEHIDSYFNAGEYTLAVEAILYNVVNDKIPLSASEREKILWIARETKAGGEYLEPFKAMKPS